MLYSCTHVATVGIKGLKIIDITASVNPFGLEIMWMIKVGCQSIGGGAANTCHLAP